MWEPAFLGSSQGQTWFLAIAIPYLKVMVDMPDSHVQRIHQGFHHVRVWQVSHSSQMTTGALLLTSPVLVDD